MSKQQAIILAVALGSGLGAVLRYTLSITILTLMGPGLIWGALATLLVNMLGSWLMGLYAALTGPDGLLPTGPVMSQFVLTGFCGGFTTFSLFSLEALLWWEQGYPAMAVGQVMGSVALWMLAVWLGYTQGMAINQRRRAAKAESKKKVDTD
ncbi:CrcB protein [Ectothiorhodospira magna]|uniref:Fluoride-specific ion channel FluC n=1 Tax=Ectothiorhodospira magna TaxID=867345 RepID=A0A1H8YZR5_9GAMM|nr:CrcB family protein [Ectothiorhodospira magna]SEP56858.1 CrcB protein [Ectothiorhodospira magna]